MKDKSKQQKPPAITVSASPSPPDKPVQRTFPGPRAAQSPLRVAVDRSPHAELVAHAKESLDAEVCGVLVGETCEDDEGVFVQVAAIIRGSKASGGSTHVTFTQETWNVIHATLDRDYPKLRIVGWYHTHPGFGVEFSAMDLFIQQNFFAGAEQIALVTDPLSGAVAIAANRGTSITYLPRYWVDGREHPALIPAATPHDSASSAAGSGATSESVGLESRVNQLAHAVDELQATLHRFLLIVGGAICLAIIFMVGWFIREQFRERIKPPEMNQVVPIPIKIGDKNVLLGVAITQWQVPEELNGILLDLAKLEADEKAKAEAAQAAAKPAAPTPAPESAPASAPASTPATPAPTPPAPEPPAAPKP